MDGNVTHDLGDALGLCGQQRAHTRGRTLRDENDAGATDDAPHKILFARESDGLLGDNPAALNLRERNLDGTGGFLDLCVQRAACQEAEKGKCRGDGPHDADNEPANPGGVRQERQQHERGDDECGGSQEHPRECRICACGQSVCVEDVLIEAPLRGGILFTHSISILRAYTLRKSTRPTWHYVR